MRSSKRIVFSFILLFAFLIPTIGESLHELSHANDFHCNEKSVHHLHESEHHCVICDFSFTSYYSDILKPELKAITFSVVRYNFEISSSIFYEETSTVALRGPPCC